MMPNTRHDAPKPPPRFVGMQRSIRRHLLREGKIKPGPKREFPEGFSPTKGWGWASRRGKRSNG